MTNKVKQIIGVISITVILAALLFAIAYILRTEPDTITVKKAHYDSLKRELLTIKQIHEKAGTIDITDTHVQDSIIREYERRHGL